MSSACLLAAVVPVMYSTCMDRAMLCVSPRVAEGEAPHSTGGPSSWSAHRVKPAWCTMQPCSRSPQSWRPQPNTHLHAASLSEHAHASCTTLVHRTVTGAGLNASAVLLEHTEQHTATRSPVWCSTLSGTCRFDAVPCLCLLPWLVLHTGHGGRPVVPCGHMHHLQCSFRNDCIGHVPGTYWPLLAEGDGRAQCRSGLSELQPLYRSSHTQGF